jgi:DNA mismatch repair protein MutS
MLEAGRNNYLAAVIRDGQQAGLAYADITTGEFAATQLDSLHELVEELARLSPAELLLAEGDPGLLDVQSTVSRLPNWRFEESVARQTLEQHFGVRSLDAFDSDGKPLVIRAAGAVIHYLNETQRGALGQIQRLTTYSLSGFMSLGRATHRHLELTESMAGDRRNSLLGVLDKSVTPMGARLLRQRITRPLLSIDALNRRLDQVDAFFSDGLLRADLRKTLRSYPDLERLCNRVVSNRASPRDLDQIRVALLSVPAVRKLLGAPEHAQSDSLRALAERLDPCPEALELLAQAIVADAPANLNKPGVIRPGFSAELDGVVNSSAHAREWVAALEPRERERTGIQSLKVGFNKVFGYYLEVSRANSHRVPDVYIRKQTLTNAERYITPELKEYETLILNAEDRILEIERRLFGEICERIGRFAGRILETAQVIARLDVAAALAEVAAAQGYVRPTLDDTLNLDIRAGRHPVVELSDQMERFVPNDSRLTAEERILLVTGPNMAGKSTILRQVALIALMAQTGSFVPAESAHIGLVDRIFTRIGAHDELHAGRSTFMVEMVEAAEILHLASPRSLLILDEIGRGTSTYDGLSIAWAMIEYLHNHPRLKPRTLFATHYHELVGLAETLPLVFNYNVAVTEQGEEVIFLHKLVPGSADRSYGIHVAQLAGLPRDVIRRAREILDDLEEHAPTASITPSYLKPAQQIALFPTTSPLLDELQGLDVTTMTPLEAMNKLYEWQRRYTPETSRQNEQK